MTIEWQVARRVDALPASPEGSRFHALLIMGVWVQNLHPPGSLHSYNERGSGVGCGG